MLRSLTCWSVSVASAMLLPRPSTPPTNGYSTAVDLAAPPPLLSGERWCWSGTRKLPCTWAPMPERFSPDLPELLLGSDCCGEGFSGLEDFAAADVFCFSLAEVDLAATSDYVVAEDGPSAAIPTIHLGLAFATVLSFSICCSCFCYKPVIWFWVASCDLVVVGI